MSLEKKIETTRTEGNKEESINYSPIPKEEELLIKKKTAISEMAVNMVKEAMQKLLGPREYYTDKYHQVSSNDDSSEQRKRTELDLVEKTLFSIYPKIPIKKYDEKESIDPSNLWRAKGELIVSILDYFKEEKIPTEIRMDYARKWAEDLSFSLAYGKDKAITILLNNIETKFPNNATTEKIESILYRLHKKYDLV
ncbi:MAG: hypothetical protein Q7S27_03580 [Nanoarchaeota archaeon]|nr:hypothetical protein [Nanoarchaeota archaeon]